MQEECPKYSTTVRGDRFGQSMQRRPNPSGRRAISFRTTYSFSALCCRFRAARRNQKHKVVMHRSHWVFGNLPQSRLHPSVHRSQNRYCNRHWPWLALNPIVQDSQRQKRCRRKSSSLLNRSCDLNRKLVLRIGAAIGQHKLRCSDCYYAWSGKLSQTSGPWIEKRLATVWGNMPRYRSAYSHSPASQQGVSKFSGLGKGIGESF